MREGKKVEKEEGEEEEEDEEILYKTREDKERLQPPSFLPSSGDAIYPREITEAVAMVTSKLVYGAQGTARKPALGCCKFLASTSQPSALKGCVRMPAPQPSSVTEFP